MLSKRDTKKSLDSLALEISQVPGVSLVVLFGSHARGEADEASDLDLLVLFSSHEERTDHQDQVYAATARSPLFVQAVCLDVDELPQANPVFLRQVFQEGRILAMKPPTSLPAELLSAERYAIVTYDLSALTPSEKHAFLYRAYGKEGDEHTYPGFVDDAGGFKVGRSAFAVPLHALGEIERKMRERGIRHQTRLVYVPTGDPPEDLAESLSTRPDDDSEERPDSSNGYQGGAHT